MSGDYDRVRALLLDAERLRLDEVDLALRHVDERFGNLAAALAESIEGATDSEGGPRLARALAELTAESLALAIDKRPGAVAQALFPVVGPTIRKALSEALRGVAHDLDQALQDTFSLKALRWRLEAWRTGVPYAHVVMRHRFKYRVEHLFLIQRDSGLLLDHESTLDVTQIDVDAVAGMLTAIEQFVQDSMSTVDSGLGEATVGQYRLLVSHGPLARVAAFVRGVAPSELSGRLGEITERLHSRWGQALASTHDMRRGQFIAPSVLVELNSPQENEQGEVRKRSLALMALGGGVLLLAIVMGLLNYRWRHELGGIRRELAAIPGVVLLGARPMGRGEVQIHILRDMAAEDPKRLLAAHYPDVTSEWRVQPYLSSDPQIIVRRVKQQLMLPDSVAVSCDGSGLVRLEGEVSFSRWYEIQSRPAVIPGVRRLDAKLLTYPGRGRAEDLIGKIEAKRIDYSHGTALNTTGLVRLEELLAQVDELQAQSKATGMTLQIQAFGFTDEPGAAATNRELRLQRAEVLVEAIRSRTQGQVAVDVGPETLFASGFHGRYRAANLQVAVVPTSKP